jgi:undecaprenyl-diphosphatase
MKKKLFVSLAKIPYLRRSAAAPILFLEIILGFILSILSLSIFREIAENVLSQQTQSWDIAISHAVYSIRISWLTQIMFGLTFLGEAETILSGVVLVLIFLVWKRHKNEAILFFTLILMGGLLNLYLKDIFQRPRPSIAPLMDLTSYSFPSGHAMNSFIFYSILAYFVFHFTRNKMLSIGVSCFALVLIFLVGFSRIYLGVHYPSDVLAGFIAGFSVFVTAILLDRTLIFFRIKKEKK